MGFFSICPLGPLGAWVKTPLGTLGLFFEVLEVLEVLNAPNIGKHFALP